MRARVECPWRAAQNGITVKRCSHEELKTFFKLHLDLRKNKYRIFPQPYRFFENIWQQYMEKGQGILLGAFDAGGKMIAANIYLVCGNTLYYKFNTSSLQTLTATPAMPSKRPRRSSVG